MESIFRFVYTDREWNNMKRIAFLVCALVLLVANTAEARRNRRPYYVTYSRPVAAAPAAVAAPATSAAAPDSAAETDDEEEMEGDTSAAMTVAESTSATTVKTVSYSTSTAQGVANIMASRNYVGHFGGNPGYEGCGCGATAAAAYYSCCYSSSGMATVDVGYAQAANGMWYCCRRYR
jgi:hypothetical protein